MKNSGGSEGLTSTSAGPTAMRLAARALAAAPLLLLLLLVTAFATVDARVVAPGNLLDVSVQAAPTLVLALGTFVVLLSGGIDLTAGVGVALCGLLMAGQLVAGHGLLTALAAGAAAMVILGLINGMLISMLGIPPFIATLATLAATQGATLAVAQTGVLIVKSAWLHALGFGVLLGVPNSIVFAAAVVLMASLLMRRTRFGLRAYALGSDPAAALLAGVPVMRQTLLTYLAASCFTFLATVLMIGRVVVVTPDLGGTRLLLDAIAAAVLGGTSIFGGKGTVAGVIAGALIVSLLTNALRVFGVDPSSIDLYKGLIIVLALCTDAGFSAARRRLSGRLA